MRLATGLLVAALGGSLATYLITRRAEAVPVATGETVELKRLRAEVATLRSSLNRRDLRLPPGLPPAASAHEQTADLEDGDPPEPSAEGSAEPRVFPAGAALDQNLHDRYDALTRDPAWSREALPIVEHDMQLGLPDGSRVTATDCKASLCRAELAYPSMDAYTTHARAVLMHNERAWRGPSIFTNPVEGRNGAVTASVYLAKSEQELLNAAAD